MSQQRFESLPLAKAATPFDISKWHRGERMPYGDVGLTFDPNAKGVVASAYFEGRINGDSRACLQNADDTPRPVVTRQPPAPPDATRSSHTDGWTECHVLAADKRAIANTPGFPAPLERPSEVAHCIRPSPTGGLGVFATRRLHPGDLIFAERALLMTSLKFLSLGLVQGVENWFGREHLQALLLSGEKMLEYIVGRMSPERRDAYMALHNCHTKDGSGPLFGRLRTNGFKVSSSSMKEAYSGVFDEISRINHSCGPNTGRSFDMKSFSMRVYACRDIEEAEELTTPYGLVLVAAIERQKELTPYGFACSCPHCHDPESDARRRRIIEEFDVQVRTVRLMDWIYDLSLPDDYLVKETKEALRVIEKEGLEFCGQYTGMLLQMCAIYSANGKNKKAFDRYKAKLLRAWIGTGSPYEKLLVIFQTDIVPLQGERERLKARQAQ